MAYIPLATQIAGGTASAAGWANLVKGNFESMGPHLIARRTADQSVTSSTVLVDDNTLILPVLANEVYKAEWRLRVTASSTGDFKCGFTFPTAGEVGYHLVFEDASAVLTSEQRAYTTSPTNAMTMNVKVDGNLSLTIPVLYVGGANAGDVKIQFAQATSNATPTTMKPNSTLWAVKLA